MPGAGPAQGLAIPFYLTAVLDPVAALIALDPPHRAAGHVALVEFHPYLLDSEQFLGGHDLVGGQLALVLVFDFRAVLFRQLP